MMQRASSLLLGRPAVRSVRTSSRPFSTRRKMQVNRLSPQILDALPQYDMTTSPKSPDPAAYERGPVTSAHAIDVVNEKVSMLDSAALSGNGNVQHGHYGDLGSNVAATVPLEYLALLRPAAEGAAALRQLSASGGDRNEKKGTLLVYGASQASGLALAQLASAAGHAVVGVVDGQHAGHDNMLAAVKNLIVEPGTAVPETYAFNKTKFAALVRGISTGHDGIAAVDAAQYLRDFQQNFIDYCAAYPHTRPAAVSERHLEFHYMEKDREYWEQNMEAFMSQYPPGAPPVDAAKLEAMFTVEQYQVLRDKFWHQTSAVISGDDNSGAPFSPPHIVQQQIQAPEQRRRSSSHEGALSPAVPYCFDIVDPTFPAGTEARPGGPILGAAIAWTPQLASAAQTVADAAAAAAGKSQRAMGEALAFMSSTERAAWGAASSVAHVARQHHTPVLVMGGKLAGDGLPTVQANDADVKTALTAMDIDEDGHSVLNYFVQVYRATDFPFYADYAVHNACEEMAGPRQLIVTK